MWRQPKDNLTLLKIGMKDGHKGFNYNSTILLLVYITDNQHLGKHLEWHSTYIWINVWGKIVILKKVTEKVNLRNNSGEFPGCPVVRILRFHSWRPGFAPWLEN